MRIIQVARASFTPLKHVGNPNESNHLFYAILYVTKYRCTNSLYIWPFPSYAKVSGVLWRRLKIKKDVSESMSSLKQWRIDKTMMLTSPILATPSLVISTFELFMSLNTEGTKVKNCVKNWPSRVWWSIHWRILVPTAPKLSWPTERTNATNNRKTLNIEPRGWQFGYTVQTFVCVYRRPCIWRSNDVCKNKTSEKLEEGLIGPGSIPISEMTSKQNAQ